MNKNIGEKLFLVAVLLILVVGCAAKNPLASKDDDDEGTPPPVEESNIVRLRQKTFVNDDLWVEVYAKDISEDVFGASFYVAFDSTKLQYQEFSAGDFFPADSVTYIVTVVSGKVIVGIAYNDPNTQRNGSGVIINLHFKVIGSGSLDLSFENYHLQNNIPEDVNVKAWYGVRVPNN